MTDNFISPIWRTGLFDNTVVFCTGGAGTICSVQVKALVYLGADACIVGRNPTKTEAMAVEIGKVRKGAKVIGLGNVDVRKLEAVEEAVETCVRRLGRLDYVIAGAAGNFVAPISGLSANGFKTVIEIDLIGSFNTVKATMPHLIQSAERVRKEGKGTGGRIVFVSATQHYNGLPGQSHVGAAKAGVDALAVSVCNEYGPFGITSNIISPGPIEGTEGMERLAPPDQMTAAEQADQKRVIPTGRWGKPSEIADSTVFLFSHGGDYINGATLIVDGGAWRTGMGGVMLRYQDEMSRLARL